MVSNDDKQVKIVHNNPAQFLGGFTLGVFAGAAGLFLFGTDHGKKLGQQLADEWDQAKESLADRGVIENKDVTLGEMLRGVLHKMSDGEGGFSLDFLKDMGGQVAGDSSVEKPQKVGKNLAEEKGKPTKKTRKAKTLKFKGV
ncbi:MAG: hypothetical protein ACOZAN_01835 [Patescibacteria group bacterium]